jgi:hypothetical protein
MSLLHFLVCLSGDYISWGRLLFSLLARGGAVPREFDIKSFAGIRSGRCV